MSVSGRPLPVVLTLVSPPTTSPTFPDRSFATTVGELFAPPIGTSLPHPRGTIGVGTLLVPPAMSRSQRLSRLKYVLAVLLGHLFHSDNL